MNQTSSISSYKIWRGELALAAAVIINSFGVVLMLYSGAGISAISSVPYAFSEVFPKISLGTWTYIFQGLLVLSLMILRKRFIPSYLFSFVVGFAFSELLDVHSAHRTALPGAVFCAELSDSQFRHRSVQPLWTSYHSYGSVSPGTFGNSPHQIFQY